MNSHNIEQCGCEGCFFKRNQISVLKKWSEHLDKIEKFYFNTGFNTGNISFFIFYKRMLVDSCLISYPVYDCRVYWGPSCDVNDYELDKNLLTTPEKIFEIIDKITVLI